MKQQCLQNSVEKAWKSTETAEWNFNGSDCNLKQQCLQNSVKKVWKSTESVVGLAAICGMEMEHAEAEFWYFVGIKFDNPINVWFGI